MIHILAEFRPEILRHFEEFCVIYFFTNVNPILIRILISFLRRLLEIMFAFSLSQRYTRLTAEENVIKAAEKERIANLRKYKTVDYSTPCHPVGQTFWHKSDKDMSKMIRTAFEMKMSDEKTEKEEKKLDFHPGQYRENKWCHDTPGTISEDQVINLFTQEEIMKILPNLPMLPRTLSVQAGLTIFIGGVARLDVLSGPEDPRWSKWPLILTAFFSDELPINVVR